MAQLRPARVTTAAACPPAGLPADYSAMAACSSCSL